VKITTRDLHFSYNKRPVLQEVDLSLNPAEVLALIGPNGAGKSTLLRCLDRMLKPASGVIRFDDRPLADFKSVELARRLAYVPQNARHHLAACVWEVVLMGRKPHLSFRVTDRDKAIVAECLELLGLGWAAERPLDELSGGEQQKVLLARALAQETDVLLLDEPTSNLDVRHQLEVMDLIRRLVREKGVSVVVAVHDLNLAARCADRLAMLHRRRVVAVGPPRDVLTREALADVYGIDARVSVHPEGDLMVFPLRPVSPDDGAARGHAIRGNDSRAAGT